LVVVVAVDLIQTHPHKQKVVEMVDHMLVEEMPETQFILEPMALLEQVVVEEDLLLEMDMLAVLVS
jgi:hypothetical protein